MPKPMAMAALSEGSMAVIPQIRKIGIMHCLVNSQVLPFSTSGSRVSSEER